MVKEGWVLTDFRFIDCEKWRKSTKLDEELPNWDYPEKAEIFKYYPQYYHKTDRVGFYLVTSVVKSNANPWLPPLRTGAPCTSSSSAAST